MLPCQSLLNLTGMSNDFLPNPDKLIYAFITEPNFEL